jgi:hypothetical protein
VDAGALERLIGAEAWGDLRGWLERKLLACWREHGGTPLHVPGVFAVTFQTLDDALRCTAFVQRSLREHRAAHGFAPPVHVGIVDRDAGAEPIDESAAIELAQRAAALGTPGEAVVLADAADPALAGRDLGTARLTAADAERDVFVLRLADGR